MYLQIIDCFVFQNQLHFVFHDTLFNVTLETSSNTLRIEVNDVHIIMIHAK